MSFSMTVGQLDDFFYQRDLPEAMKIVGTLRLVKNCLIASYQERDRTYGWERRSIIFYRFMGMTHMLNTFSSFNEGEDVLVSDYMISVLCSIKNKSKDKDKVEIAQQMIRDTCHRSLNNRETYELARSFQDAMAESQKVNNERLQKALNMHFGRSRYLLKDVDKALAEREAARLRASA
jgi:hypothetical protein